MTTTSSSSSSRKARKVVRFTDDEKEKGLKSRGSGVWPVAYSYLSEGWEVVKAMGGEGRRVSVGMRVREEDERDSWF